MTELDLAMLDRSVRDEIQLLKKISSSKAFSASEKGEISALVMGFLGKINNISLKLGIIGEFNAGKSTLLNAILGKQVVATSDRPCTPVPVYIQGGTREGLSVVGADGTETSVGLEEYTRYTTDGEAPSGVQSIRMTVNSPLLLENRITLIDTPGINAINPLHTQITESALSEMHAAILLMYSKQPGSKSTIDFLKNAAQQTGKIFVCISKSDFLSGDQLDRIVTALPERLSKNSGVVIDKVYPIHFNEDGGGSDFDIFFNELKQFMLTGWYQAISKEVETVLSSYSDKISHLVQNKLELEERLFFDFMKNTPVDFSALSMDLQGKVQTHHATIFDHDEFYDHASRIGGQCLESIRSQLYQDLEPDKAVMLFFDKRVSEKTLKKATTNSNVHFKQMAKVEQHVGSLTKDFIEAVQNLSVESLRSVNGMLEDFRDKVRAEIMARPAVIAAAKRKRFWRWMIADIVIAGCLSASALVPQVHATTLMKEVLFGLAGLLLLIPWAIATKPSNHDLERLAEKELKDMQCFEVPTFINPSTGNLTARGIDTSGTFWNKDRQTSFNRTGGQVARAAYNLGGAGAGLEVAAVLSVVNYTLSYFSKPKAKDVYQEILGQTEQEISNYRERSLQSFLKLKASIMESANQYVSSLPERYSAVLQEAFDQNSQLLESRKETVVELEGFLKRLQNPART